VTETSLYFSGDSERDEFTAKVYGFPPLKPADRPRPNTAWNVISPTSVVVFDGGWDTRNTVQYGGRTFVIRPWYQQVEPTERVGALLLYHVSAPGL
jgi:hypothetical protein